MVLSECQNCSLGHPDLNGHKHSSEHSLECGGFFSFCSRFRDSGCLGFVAGPQDRKSNLPIKGGSSLAGLAIYAARLVA